MVNAIPIEYGYTVRWQSDLVYTIKSAFPVCDKPYHMNNGFQQMTFQMCGTMHYKRTSKYDFFFKQLWTILSITVGHYATSHKSRYTFNNIWTMNVKNILKTNTHAENTI